MSQFSNQAMINLIKSLRDNYNDVNQDDGLTELLETQLAIAIASHLEVPANKTLNAKAFYTDEHHHTVRTLVSEINELYLLDVGRVLAMIEKMYITRFDLVNNPVKAVDALTAIAQVACAKEDGAPIVLNASDLTRLHTGVGELFNQSTVE